MAKRKVNSALRNLRRARSISQEDLARLVGTTQETISKAESGRLRLSPDLQALIATILGGSRAALFGESTDANESVAS